MNRIQKLLSKWLPQQTRIIDRGNSEPPVQLHMVDVDELHSALRSAEAGNTSELFSIYRDIIGSHSHLQSEFSKRKLAVLGDQFNVTAKDPDDEAQVKHAEDVKTHLKSLPNWIRILTHILDSTLYPVSVTDRLYKEGTRPGWRYEFKELSQVKHHHLSWPNGDLSLGLTDDQGNQTGQCELIDEDRYIIHRGHLLTSSPDWHGGPMRAVLFWWLFSVSSRDWWARFLDRFGSPFLEGKYDSGDDGARFTLQSAFQQAQRLLGVVVSKDVEIKMHQANSQGGGEAFQAFHNVANKEMSKIVVGQTLSAEGENLGFGGGQGEAQSQVRDDIRQFDAVTLGLTIETQILSPLWLANGWTTPIPTVSFGAESTDELAVTSDILSALPTAGLQVTDEAIKVISKKLGYTVERATASPLAFAAFSAQPQPQKDHFLPTVSRRAARKRQARRATEAVVASASPQLAKIMTRDFDQYTQALEDSTSPQDALDRLAILTASYDPTEAAMIVRHALSAASANALIASDHTH